MSGTTTKPSEFIRLKYDSSGQCLLDYVRSEQGTLQELIFEGRFFYINEFNSSINHISFSNVGTLNSILGNN